MFNFTETGKLVDLVGEDALRKLILDAIMRKYGLASDEAVILLMPEADWTTGYQLADIFVRITISDEYPLSMILKPK